MSLKHTNYITHTRSFIFHEETGAAVLTWSCFKTHHSLHCRLRCPKEAAFEKVESVIFCNGDILIPLLIVNRQMRNCKYENDPKSQSYLQ